ncbi:DUF6191 domain-containing protein [Streptomyces sp. ACA25]|uniref:DUF6191 domain-containing protein n=1 Tax=Streptomyces sp. ACA25 TaxID=3022596 RepID=UPI00230793E6|nr:DUF6191 domain-containing protein [Streptomyces sp. ACA25]MDB1089374.1 DUF6191 domain-containing protein [Streptomyces sp. ACA25]
MEFIFFMTLPGLVILLTAVAFTEQLLLRAGRAGIIPWRGNADRGQLSATGFEMLHVSLLPGKETELAQREVTRMLKDEEGDGAPPRSRVDLDLGTAVIRLRGGG